MLIFLAVAVASRCHALLIKTATSLAPEIPTPVGPHKKRRKRRE
jgi:hypothetical protein